MTPTPDFGRVATLALEAIEHYDIVKLPIQPQEIIKQLPNTIIIPYRDLEKMVSLPRKIMVAQSEDATTGIFNLSNDKHFYVIGYNMEKPFAEMRLTLAHEMARIFCHHVGAKQEDVMDAEASQFARHFLFPRPLLKECLDRGMPLTEKNLCAIAHSETGVTRHISIAPGCHTPPELNRRVRERFKPYADNLFASGVFTEPTDDDPIVDIGSYLVGYEDL